MTSLGQTHLIDYLQTELALPSSSIELAIRQQSSTAGPLPMILLQHGLITLEQVAQIFDYLEHTSVERTCPPPFHPLLGRPKY